MQETAADYRIDLPIAELIQSYFTDMIANGNGEKDLSSLAAHLRGILNK